MSVCRLALCIVFTTLRFLALRARVVGWSPSQRYVAFELCGPTEILVMASTGPWESVGGDIKFLRLAQRQIGGLVTDGSVRDTDEILKCVRILLLQEPPTAPTPPHLRCQIGARFVQGFLNSSEPRGPSEARQTVAWTASTLSGSLYPFFFFLFLVFLRCACVWPATAFRCGLFRRPRSKAPR